MTEDEQIALNRFSSTADEIVHLRRNQTERMQALLNDMRIEWRVGTANSDINAIPFDIADALIRSHANVLAAELRAAGWSVR